MHDILQLGLIDGFGRQHRSFPTHVHEAAHAAAQLLVRRVLGQRALLLEPLHQLALVQASLHVSVQRLHQRAGVGRHRHHGQLHQLGLFEQHAPLAQAQLLALLLVLGPVGVDGAEAHRHRGQLAAAHQPLDEGGELEVLAVEQALREQRTHALLGEALDRLDHAADGQAVAHVRPQQHGVGLERSEVPASHEDAITVAVLLLGAGHVLDGRLGLAFAAAAAVVVRTLLHAVGNELVLHLIGVSTQRIHLVFTERVHLDFSGGAGQHTLLHVGQLTHHVSLARALRTAPAPWPAQRPGCPSSCACADTPRSGSTRSSRAARVGRREIRE